MHEKVIPTVLCIDVEPDLDHFITIKDEEERARSNTWLSFRAASDFFDGLRSNLAGEDDEPRFAWFVRADPQVEFDFGSADYGFSNFADCLETWVSHGDQIGVHVHAWRMDRDAKRWVEDRVDRAWIERCVRTSIGVFKMCLGYCPRCFRFGNRWMDTDTMNLIRELGTKIDMTLEPGYVDSPWSPHLRGFTDWANIPRSPYMPATDDYSQPARAASSGLFELPLSTVPISIVKKTERILSIAKALSSRKRNQLDKPHGPLLRELRWYLGTKYESLYVATSAFFFRRGVRWILETQENPYFALVVRSDDCIDIDACSRMKGNLRILADEARNVGASLAFTTPDKALRMLGIANDGID